MGGYEYLCEKKGWTKKNEYDLNVPVRGKFKLIHYCPKCSLEHVNKLQEVN